MGSGWSSRGRTEPGVAAFLGIFSFPVLLPLLLKGFLLISSLINPLSANTGLGVYVWGHPDYDVHVIHLKQPFSAMSVVMMPISQMRKPRPEAFSNRAKLQSK